MPMKKFIAFLLLTLFAFTVEQTTAGPPIDVGQSQELIIKQFTPAMQAPVLHQNNVWVTTPRCQPIVETKEASPLLMPINECDLYNYFNTRLLAINNPDIQSYPLRTCNLSFITS